MCVLYGNRTKKKPMWRLSARRYCRYSNRIIILGHSVRQRNFAFHFFRLRPVIANFWHVQHAQDNGCETDMNIESLEWWPMAIKYNTNVFVSIGYHFFSSSSSSQYINTKSIPFSNLKRRLFERMHCVRLAARQINIEYLRTASIPSLCSGNCNDSSNMTQFVHERDIRLRRKAVG